MRAEDKVEGEDAVEPADRGGVQDDWDDWEGRRTMEGEGA